MKTIYSEQHRLRDAKTELYGGELVQPFERPSRADIIIKALVESGLGEISDPDMFALDPVLAATNQRNQQYRPPLKPLSIKLCLAHH
jgi:hypothetical protein